MEMQREKIITVTGKGYAYTAPDVTRITIDVVSIGKTYPELYERAQNNLQELGSIVERHGLNKKIAKTQHFEIERNERSVYDKNGHFTGYKFDGYKLSQKMKIDLGIDNKLLSSIVQAIGHLLYDAQISIGYTVKDSRPAELRMLEKAVKDATEKAQIMAKAAGCKLGLVKSIDYSEQDIEFYSECRDMPAVEAKCCNFEAMEMTPDDIAGGQTVTVTWYLSNGKEEK
jgi:uncharacterized protein YggE